MHFADFDIFVLRCTVIIRDKVGNCGQFNDKTLFGNESKLPTKIAFTYCMLLACSFSLKTECVVHWNWTAERETTGLKL